jgi:hypothetical protein
MQRRDFLKGGITAVAASFLQVSASADGKRPVTWAPYQNLDLDPQDMVKDEDIARIIWYAKEFIPQTCTGRPAYDPQNPNKPGTERRLEGYGKRIHGSEMSIAVPNTYSKAIAIKQGLARLLAADKDHAVRDMLSVGLQFHTIGFDHPTDGIAVPLGFNWDWVMTVPQKIADGCTATRWRGIVPRRQTMPIRGCRAPTQVTRIGMRMWHWSRRRSHASGRRG